MITGGPVKISAPTLLVVLHLFSLLFSRPVEEVLDKYRQESTERHPLQIGDDKGQVIL